jgi:ribosomal protein S27E
MRCTREYFIKPEEKRFERNGPVWCPGDIYVAKSQFVIHQPKLCSDPYLSPFREVMCFDCAEQSWFLARRNPKLRCPICKSIAAQHPIDMMIECRFCGPVWKWALWDGCSCGTSQKNRWMLEHTSGAWDPDDYLHDKLCEKYPHPIVVLPPEPKIETPAKLSGSGFLGSPESGWSYGNSSTT